MPERIVANGRFKLVGTDNQVAILEPVFTVGSPAFISFPWAQVDALPSYPVPISWDDLNDGTLSRGTYDDDPGSTRSAGPLHPHFHGDEGEGHGVSRPGEMLGEPTQRHMIAGVFWTDGRIKIDIRLESRPDAAREVLSAELAHAVDYGLPLTDQMKTQLTTALHPAGGDTHTWWEQQSYGAEYYTLVGEAFMAIFTHAYSGMEPWQEPFTHKSTKALAPEVHQILGAAPVGSSTEIRLSGRSWITTFGNGRVELLWSDARGDTLTVRRNDVNWITTANDGKLVSNLATRRGTFRYQLVDRGGRKSNIAVVNL